MAKHGAPYCSVSSWGTKLSMPRSGALTLQFLKQLFVNDSPVITLLVMWWIFSGPENHSASSGHAHSLPVLCCWKFICITDYYFTKVIFAILSIYSLPYITTLCSIKQTQTELSWNFDPYVWIYITHWSVKHIILCLTFGIE